MPYCDPEIQVAPQRQEDGDFDEPIRLQGSDENEIFNRLNEKMRNLSKRVKKVEKNCMEQIAQAVNQSERQIRDEINSRLALVNRNQQQTNIEMKNAFQVKFKIKTIMFKFSQFLRILKQIEIVTLSSSQNVLKKLPI